MWSVWISHVGEDHPRRSQSAESGPNRYADIQAPRKGERADWGGRRKVVARIYTDRALGVVEHRARSEIRRRLAHFHVHHAHKVARMPVICSQLQTPLPRTANSAGFGTTFFENTRAVRPTFAANTSNAYNINHLAEPLAAPRLCQPFCKCAGKVLMALPALARTACAAMSVQGTGAIQSGSARHSCTRLPVRWLLGPHRP